ncbi:hypothetical protein [Rhodohalobacter sp. 614A]|uniref:hypothetical protein n=1 Tax=Rhodohalobacter sp. 614A TaxID=2908649 RepID=UPI001F1FDE0E|nr:hypothetical protein [Rhodohalobacter sp. 614A]
MKALLITLSIIGLGMTIIPSVLVFIQEISFESHKQWMLIGMILWFATAPLWIREQKL